MTTMVDRIVARLTNSEDKDGKPILLTPLLGHLLAIVVLIALGMSLAKVGGHFALIGISLIIAVASLTLGGSVGFLFAIPRVATQAQTEATIAAAVAAAVKGATPAGGNADSQMQRNDKQRLLNTNNNLEKVSDWLTTMLVGVGLTQLGNIDSALYRFRLFLRDTAVIYPASTGNRAGLLPLVGPMLLIGGLAIGFVYFYVYTRIVIAPSFYRVEETFDRDRPRVRSGRDVEVVKEVAKDLPIDNKATRAVAADAAPSVDDALSVMFDALYQPDGYKSVIKVGTALRATDAVNRPEYWFYLAAAYGQAFAAAGTDEERKATRTTLLDAASRAVAISPSYRARLWQISNPDGYDNDLAALRADPDFLAIVGRSGTPSS